jgi:hypothetical protein
METSVARLGFVRAAWAAYFEAGIDPDDAEGGFELRVVITTEFSAADGEGRYQSKRFRTQSSL